MIDALIIFNNNQNCEIISEIDVFISNKIPLFCIYTVSYTLFIRYPNLFDSFMILFFMPLFYSFGKQIFHRMQKM